MTGIEQIREKVKKFPDSPGVYFMRGELGNIIYIGKATSLRGRVASYFARSVDDKTASLMMEVDDIGYEKMDTVVEALIMESRLINKYKPKYNIKLKDDKSFSNIVITKEDYPKVLVTRPTDREKLKAKYIFGPYISRQQAEMVVELLIKMFTCSASGRSSSDLYRMYYMKGYHSGSVGNITKKDYAKIINNIKMFLEGKKVRIIKKLEKEMQQEAKKMNFEKAAKLRNQVFALKHIRDFAFIKEDEFPELSNKTVSSRAEAYDISNISGKFAVGSMVVFTGGKPDKSEYRKFRIKTVAEANDVGMLAEMIERRFHHTEWKFPDLLVIDGGLGQKNAAKLILRKFNLDIPIVAIAKGPDRKGEKLFFTSPKDYIFPDVGFIKKMRDEAHRFAITYHRNLRSFKNNQPRFRGLVR